MPTIKLSLHAVPAPVDPMQGIAFGGATFTDWSGLMSDTPAQVKVVAQPRAAAGAGTSYTVQVPRASAALLVAQRRV